MRRGRGKRQRLLLVLLGVALVAAGAVAVLLALNEELDVFRSPSQLAEQGFTPGKRFRVGGLVADGSVTRQGLDARFSLTDGAHQVTVVYRGLLPDLFREGQGVLALGALNRKGVFMAEEVLAKHDENYMPPEIAEALKQTGVFRPAGAGGGAGAGSSGADN